MVMHDKSAKRLKGATLYTVTLVVSVMLILMLTAIALSGAAYRRASSEFRNDQTTTTARSVVTTVLDALAKQSGVEGDTLAKNLSEALRNENSTVTLNVAGDSGSNVIPGFGTVESVTFTNVGKDDESGYFITGSGQNIIKVTATVSFGYDKTNTTTYTQYVTNSITSDAKAGGSGGFIAAGGMSLPTSTSVKFFGESYTGIDDNANKNVILFRNAATLEGGNVYNSSVYFTASGSRIELSAVNGKDNGVYIDGNFAMLNNTAVNVNFDHSLVSRINNLPYVYVNGTFATTSQFNTGSGEDGFNLMTGRFMNLKPEIMKINANIFCYNTDTGVEGINDEASLKAHMNEGLLDDMNVDENKMNQLNAQGSDVIDSFFKSDSGISIFRSNGSSLLNWASGIVTGQKNGSIYSRGSVWLQNDSHVGDVVVCGALLIDISGNGTCEITGNVYADTLCITGKNNYLDYLSVGGTIYCNKLIGATPDPGRFTVVTPVPNPITSYFPQGMASKEDVLGKTDGHSDYKIVKTSEDARAQFYDEDLHKYKTSVNVSPLNVSANSKIYYMPNDSSIYCVTPGGTAAPVGQGTKVEITESCTLVGKFNQSEITIIPSNGEEIWINLFNFETTNGNKTIVDDSNGSVNFFIPMKDNYCDVGISQAAKTAYINEVKNILGTAYSETDNYIHVRNTAILTKRYYDDFLTPTGQTYSLKPLHLKTYYTAEEEKDNVDGNYVPDIYIYAADNVLADDGTTHIAPDIQFENNCIVTGNLISPYSNFKFDNNGIQGNAASNMHYTVAGSATESNMANVNGIAWIGSVLVGGIGEIVNDFTFFYVARSPEGSDNGGDEDIFRWDIINGYATY